MRKDVGRPQCNIFFSPKCLYSANAFDRWHFDPFDQPEEVTSALVKVASKDGASATLEAGVDRQEFQLSTIWFCVNIRRMCLCIMECSVLWWFVRGFGGSWFYRQCARHSQACDLASLVNKKSCVFKLHVIVIYLMLFVFSIVLIFGRRRSPRCNWWLGCVQWCSRVPKERQPPGIEHDPL